MLGKHPLRTILAEQAHHAVALQRIEVLRGARIMFGGRRLTDTAARNNKTAADGVRARQRALVCDPLERAGTGRRSVPVAEAFAPRVTPRAPNKALVHRAHAAASLCKKALMKRAVVGIHRANAHFVATCAGRRVRDARRAAGPPQEARGSGSSGCRCCKGRNLVVKQKS